MTQFSQQSQFPTETTAANTTAGGRRQEACGFRPHLETGTDLIWSDNSQPPTKVTEEKHLVTASQEKRQQLKYTKQLH